MFWQKLCQVNNTTNEWFNTHAVRGIGRVEIAITREPRGVIVGRLSLLESNIPIYFTLNLKMWILLIVRSIPYFFNISMKLFRTFLWVLMPGVKIINSSIMQSMYSRISGDNSCSRLFISEVKYAGETFSPCLNLLYW